MREAGVAHDHAAGVRDERGQLLERHVALPVLPAEYGLRRQSRVLRHAPGQRLLARTRGHHDPVARRLERSRQRREPVAGPAAGGGVGARVHDGRAGGGRGRRRRFDQQVVRERRHAVVAQQPAPAVPLVLVRTPHGTSDPGSARVPVREEPTGPQPLQQQMAGRSAAVQIHGDVRRPAFPRQRSGDRAPGCGGGQEPVDQPDRGDRSRQPLRGGQDDVMPAQMPPQPPQRGHGRQQISQPQRPQHEHPRPPPAVAHARPAGTGCRCAPRRAGRARTGGSGAAAFRAVRGPGPRSGVAFARAGRARTGGSGAVRRAVASRAGAGRTGRLRVAFAVVRARPAGTGCRCAPRRAGRARTGGSGAAAFRAVRALWPRSGVASRRGGRAGTGCLAAASRGGRARTGVPYAVRRAAAGHVSRPAGGPPGPRGGPGGWWSGRRGRAAGLPGRPRCAGRPPPAGPRPSSRRP